MNSTFKILILTFIVFLTSCKKCKDDEVTPVHTESTPTETFSSSTRGYLKFTLGADNYVSPSGLWFSGTPAFSTQSTPPNYYSQTNTYNSSAKTNIFVLTKKDSITEFGPKPSDNYFRNFLAVKSYPYALSQSTPLNKTNGIYIKVKDNSNNYWYSVNPVNSTSFQNSSIFQITDRVEFFDVAPSLTIKFKATFSCKLYNSVGDSIMLSNGELITSYTNT